MNLLSSIYIELFTYIVYIYFILYHFIRFERLTYPILFLTVLIIYFGTFSMFPLWKCKVSFFYNYGYIISLFYSILCVMFLYFLNMFHNNLKDNPLYILFLLQIPISYYLMIKFIQYIYKCDTLFFKNYGSIFYFSIIFIMLILKYVR